METETYVMLAIRLGYADEEDTATTLALIDEISRIITTMRRRLENE